jgi:hypothetical protein
VSSYEEEDPCHASKPRNDLPGVAIENFFNRVNAPLGIEAEGFCAVAPLDHAA